MPTSKRPRQSRPRPTAANATPTEPTAAKATSTATPGTTAPTTTATPTTTADARDHRDYVGKNVPWDYGFEVFMRLMNAGLRSTDKVLDVGCGPLRVGRFLVAYLEADGYTGIEGEQWLLDAGLDKEVGRSILNIKRPLLLCRDDWNLKASGRQFDFVLLSSVLTHASHALMRQLFADAHDVLRPQGQLICDIRPEGPDHDGPDWLYPQIAPHYQGCVEAAAAQAHLTVRALPGGSFGHLWFSLTPS